MAAHTASDIPLSAFGRGAQKFTGYFDNTEVFFKVMSQNAVAASAGATPMQVALAWLLAIADNVLLIPGTSRRGHLVENLSAGSLSLHDNDIASLNQAHINIP